MPITVKCVDVRRHHVVQVPQAIEIDIKNSHVGLKSRGNLGRVGPDHASSQNRDVGGSNSGHTAEQNPPSHLWLFQILGTLLDTHAPSDFAHRCQQRQAAALVTKRFVCQTSRSACKHGIGELAAGGKVKVGEQCLTRSDQRVFLRLRFLHLDDQLSSFKHLASASCHLRPGTQVIVVRQTGPQSCTGLNQHLVSACDQLFHAHRQHRHTVLVGLDFRWYSNNHPSITCARGTITVNPTGPWRCPTGRNMSRGSIRFNARRVSLRPTTASTYQSTAHEARSSTDRFRRAVPDRSAPRSVHRIRSLL